MKYSSAQDRMTKSFLPHLQTRAREEFRALHKRVGVRTSKRPGNLATNRRAVRGKL